MFLNRLKKHYVTKVCSLLKDGKQTAGCTEFRTETGLCSLVSVQKLEHPAVCLPTLKRERTLIKMMKNNDALIAIANYQKCLQATLATK